MRILILTQWFQPEPQFKGLPLARALIARGHNVEVLTGFPNYPGGRLYPGYRVRPWRREIMEGVKVTRAALYPSHDRSALGRILNYASFALLSALLALKLRRPDVVYVYCPPMTAAAGRLGCDSSTAYLWAGVRTAKRPRDGRCCHGSCRAPCDKARADGAPWGGLLRSPPQL